MAHEIVFNKRFVNKLSSVIEYLEIEFGRNVARAFLNNVDARINALRFHPYIGAPTGIKNTRSTVITRHNRLFYRVADGKVIILNLYDTRERN